MASQARVERGRHVSWLWDPPQASSFTQGRQEGAYLTLRRLCDHLSEKGV